MIYMILICFLLFIKILTYNELQLCTGDSTKFFKCIISFLQQHSKDSPITVSILIMRKWKLGETGWFTQSIGRGFAGISHSASLEPSLCVRAPVCVCVCVCVLVTQWCPTLFDPMDCSPPDSSVVEFSRQEYWSGFPCPSPGDLPDPGIESRSPALQADSLLSEPLGKPLSVTYHVVNHKLMKRSSWTLPPSLYHLSPPLSTY